VLLAIEEPKKLAVKRARKNRELFITEAPKLLYTVMLNNNRHQKKEAEHKPEHDFEDFEIGLPPQPKEYLKYPDYDWF